MKRKALRILAWFGGLFIAGLVSFVVVLYANQDKIINRVVQESNKLLTEPVAIASVDLSVKKFPLASVMLSEVYCKGRNALSGDTLIYAEQIYLEFHLWKLFTGDWGIEGISLENGVLKLDFPENGEPNYKIWNDNKDSASATVFNLHKVQVKNLAFALEVHMQDLDLKAHLNSAELNGLFDRDHYALDSRADFRLKHLFYREKSYLKPNEITARLNIEGTGEQIAFQDGKVNIAGFDFDFDGNYDPERFVLDAAGTDLAIADLYDFYVDQQWSDARLDASISGWADLRFSGEFPTTDKEATYQLDFEIERGNLRKDKVELKALAVTGSYQHLNDIERIDLKSFSGNGKSGRIKGALSLSDFEAPIVNLKLVSDLELSEWMLFLPLDTLTHPEGRLAVDINLSNQLRSLKKLTASELKKTRASGHIELKKVGFGFRNSDKTIDKLNASLSFGGDHLDIDNFYFQTGQSDVYLSGHFSNVLGYLFFKKEKLKLDTRVRSQELHVEDFLLTGKSGSGEYSLDFARSLEMDLQVDVAQLYFDSFYAEDVSGGLAISQGLIRGQNLSFQADQGKFDGEFSINMKGSGNYRLMANMKATNADLHELFVSFSDFGQEELVAENIYGRADMDLKLSSELSPTLYLPPESVYLTADLHIRDGILKDYQPMMALSDYAEIEELKEVRFSQLSNQISISESVIYIPDMLIESNVLDMQLRGEHHFDNSINYSMKLRLADVLFSKRKSKHKQTEFDEHLTEVEGSDDPNIYVKMLGTASYPIISLDKERMNNSIKNDLKQQGKELKQIFTKKDPEKNQKKSSGIEYTLFEEEDEGKN
jgi:hypothetical protein